MKNVFTAVIEKKITDCGLLNSLFFYVKLQNNNWNKKQKNKIFAS
jgi:hypothetical protein